MNKTLLLLTIVIVVLFTACKQQYGGIIKYKSNICNLGDITFKKEFAGKFVIYNRGTEPLKLIEATADCSCTVPDDIKNKEIMPNDSANLSFKITPAMDGYLQQNIYLDNSSKNENRVLFLIRANVRLIKD